MKMTLGHAWAKRLQKRVEGFEFEVGILEDKPHRDAVETPFGKPPQLGTYAGGPVRKAQRGGGTVSVGDVLIANMERINTNLLLKPFQDQSADINKFVKAFMQLVIKKNMALKRVENLLQAVVRNPILRQEYGPNKASTADAKGFDRHLFDTAQMFKAIKARAKRV